MDRPNFYPPVSSERKRDQESYQPFLVEVLTVDTEHKTLTVKDLATGTPYYGVDIFPANHSSHESTDVDMPAVGSVGMAHHIQQKGGFYEVAIGAWVVSDTNRAQQVIATRALDIQNLQGWNKRTRGSYRKASAGQKTKTTAEGYSERHDDGWDRLAADYSRDRLDPQARVWTNVTSRHVGYTDAGLSWAGPVVRAGAAGVPGDLLPDGTTLATVYLAPGSTASSRYVGGNKDVAALVERTVKVQEFALDYAVPAEVLDSILLNQALGVTADPWARTVVQTTASVSHDDQTFMASQTWDHPTFTGSQAVGPTLNEGPTPRRHGYILERTEGTLVGSNAFDTTTYGMPLKPVLFPYTALGKFAADVESAYLPAGTSADQVETRVAASAYSVRFPHEGNTTRWDVTKEGMLSFEIGSTLPMENIPLAGSYEYPHGAGRSIEGHLVGSLKLVVGKNRDEEDAIDLQALGQSVIRLGADDSSLPNLNRSVMTQIRGSSDAVQNRQLQFWTKPRLQPGDAGNLQAKTGAENISLRGAFDGGTVLRLGARNPASLRRHLMNGYQDGPGVTSWALSNPSRKDARTAGRLTYGAGDSNYLFHDLRQAGKSLLNRLPYFWSGSPVTNVDAHGLSLDVHAVRDILLRAGANPASGQSLLADLAGGVVAGIGKDFQGRSITATLDGGIEMTIGANAQGKGIRLEIRGDVDWTVQGNFHLNVMGDSTFESTTHQHIVKTDHIIKAQNIHHVALVRVSNEAPDIAMNQGLYSSSPEA
jgi:hypothetical protein